MIWHYLSAQRYDNISVLNDILFCILYILEINYIL